MVSKGLPLDAANPPASVFSQAAGNVGYKLFGLVMLAAAITSVIGSAYTSGSSGYQSIFTLQIPSS